MIEFVTMGETMATFIPKDSGKLRYATDYQMKIAGAESNCAIGLCKLGHSASWISRIGDDEFGQFILRTVRAEGVDVSGVSVDKNYRTGLMFKEIHPGQETKVSYYRNNSAASHLDPKYVQWDKVSQAKIFHITGITPILSKCCEKTVFTALEIAKEAQTKISFDPNIRLKLWKRQDYSLLMKSIIEKSHFVLIGNDEAEILYGTGDAHRIQEQLFTSSAIEYVALKNGDQGAIMMSSKELINIPPFPCCCIDPIGAGDAFNAGFLAGILENKSLQECGYYGAISGAKATETRGDTEGYLSKEELLQILNHESCVYR